MADPIVALDEYGDSGLLVHIHAADSEVLWSVVQKLARSLRTERPHGLVDLVASFTDVFVMFDPLLTDHATLCAVVQSRVAGGRPHAGEGREFLVPVVYGGQHGEDLEDVARELSITPQRMVHHHSSRPWTVRFRGSPVGAPMMDGPRMPTAIARRQEPRVRVPPGSVAVSGFESIVYPVASPGGWRLIGRTPAWLADPARDPIVEYLPGDRLRFVPVTPDSWDRWSGPLADVDQRLRADA